MIFKVFPKNIELRKIVKIIDVGLGIILKVIKLLFSQCLWKIYLKI